MTKRCYPMPTHCPVSGELLEVTRLESPVSGVVVEGRFAPNEFALLPPEPLEFLRLFVRVRGNLKEVERILGVSYPTVRARFEAMLRALGYESAESPEQPQALRQERIQARQKLLEALERGDISPTEAAEKLRALAS